MPILRMENWDLNAKGLSIEYLSNNDFNGLNSFLTLFISFVKEAIPINPQIRTLFKPGKFREFELNNSASSFSSKPNFVSSSEIWTCSRQSITLFNFFPCLLISESNFLLSTPCIREMKGAIYLTLFD